MSIICTFQMNIFDLAYFKTTPFSESIKTLRFITRKCNKLFLGMYCIPNNQKHYLTSLFLRQRIQPYKSRSKLEKNGRQSCPTIKRFISMAGHNSAESLQSNRQKSEINGQTWAFGPESCPSILA